MPDRDKVISHFQDAIDAGSKGNRWRFVRVDIIEDAIELLKEQEPAMWSDDGYDCFICSNCGLCVKDEVYFMMNKPISFCPACGRKVKWGWLTET